MISGPNVRSIREVAHLLYHQSKRLEEGRLYLAQAESSQSAGTHIIVDGQYGLIEDSGSNAALISPLLVRFVEKRKDGILIFERPKNPNLELEQALNAPTV